MNGAYEIGAVALRAQQRALETIANNVANINTPGFKRADVRFAEIVTVRSEPVIMLMIAGMRSPPRRRPGRWAGADSSSPRSTLSLASRDRIRRPVLCHGGTKVAIKRSG